MLKIRKIILYVFSIFLLSNCEYELTELNFKDIEPPPASRSIDIGWISTDDTIKIFQATNLNFNFDTDGLGVLLAEMTLQDRRWEFSSRSGSVDIDPDNFDNGLFKLSLTMYLQSGSGSLADKLGAEGYQITKEWNILIDDRNVTNTPPIKSINDDGYLVINWPECRSDNFIGYEISYGSQIHFEVDTITERSQNYLVDSLYIGGRYSFRVTCILVDGNQRGELFSFEEPPPQIYVEEISIDSLRIMWDKSPYNVRYRLEVGRDDYYYFENREDTTFTIPQIPLGESINLNLCTRPLSPGPWVGGSNRCGIISNTIYTFGHRLISRSWVEFAYNYQDKLIYSNRRDNLLSFDADNLSLIREKNIDEIRLGNLYSCPTNSSKLVAMNSTDIYIFDDSSLETYITLPGPSNGFMITTSIISHLTLTDNDRLAYAFSGKYNLYDVDTKQLICSIDIDDYPTFFTWSKITTSQDAKYMCSATSNGIIINQIGEDGQFEQVYSDQRSYRSVYFDPLAPDRLYVTLNEEPGIEIRNPEDFSLMDKIDFKENTEVQNIDPGTGNILVKDSDFLYIINTDTHEMVLKIPCDTLKSWLFNNRIFLRSGYTLDVSELL